MKKTSIIIALWNQLAYTIQCLESLEAFTPEEHEVILIDNGSTDGTVAWLTERLPKHPEYKLIVNDTNLGAGKATNQGIGIATGEYICFLNNDVVLSKEWLKGLIDCAESADDIGMVGPKSNYVSGPQMEMDTATGYDTIFTYTAYAESYRKAHRGAYIPYWRIIPICGLIKRAVIDKIGIFDEQFFPGNFADDDLCRRACLAGYRNMICGDVFVHHYGSVSMKQIDFAQNLVDNQKKFDAKWDALTGKTISAVMIVKDESMNIGVCISHLYPCVDEIIVVDTGSKDHTKDIAAGAGPKVKVYDFPWADDFSAARNFANSKATKDWLLSVDADENITGLNKLQLKPFHAYRIVTRNYNNNAMWANNKENEGEYPGQEKGLRWFPSTKIRLWPRDSRIRFEYPVHEVVENSVRYLGMQEVDCPGVVVHHYGRLCDDYEYGKGDKYYDLLHKQFESGKNDLRSLEQLALQAQGMSRWKEAHAFWDEVIKLDPSHVGAVFNKGHCYASEGNWDEALTWSRRALKDAPDQKDIILNVAICESMTGGMDVAVKICEDLIAKYPLDPRPRALKAAIEIKQQEANV